MKLQIPGRAVDRLTELYTKKTFFQEAANLLRQHPEKDFYLMAIDIEHFKLYNDWYGYEKGDKLLRNVGRHLKKHEQHFLCVSGYMGDDDFAILIEKKENLLEDLEYAISTFTRKHGEDLGFMPAFGVYEVKDQGLSLAAMYDRAVIAIQSVKGNYVSRIAMYDPMMKAEMETGQILLKEIGKALTEDELTYYLQPICNMYSGKIVGLEALARWIHPQRGLIPPGDFIPILEKNGVITRVDLHIWDKVIEGMGNWLKDGKQAVPVSMNASRMDVYALDLPETFRELAQKYNVPPQLLNIEITESAYMEDYDRISKVIQKLRSYGFSVFMDDFGSGYSSLNMLKDIKVDALKVDTKFLEMKPETVEQGTGILETVINMASLMNIRLIAEGVMTEEQVSFLQRSGCLYGQGFHYYRPMPHDEMEEILKDESIVDYDRVEVREIKKLSVSQLVSRNMISEQMLGNMLGGVGFYDLYRGELEILRVNNQYFQVTGSDPSRAEKGSSTKRVINGVVMEDRHILMRAFERAKADRSVGATATVRCINGNSERLWLQARIFFLREQDGHQFFYASIQNVTEQKEQERALQESKNTLEALMGLSGYSESFMLLTEENRQIARDMFSQLVACGMIGGYCEPDFPIYFVSDEIIELLGYDSYEDLVAHTDGKVINTIYEEDREAVMNDIGDSYYKGLTYTTKYRTVRKDGSMFWTLDKGCVVEGENGRLAIVSACIDISESVELQEKLDQMNLQNKQIVEDILENSAYNLKANITKDEIVMDAGSRKWLEDNDYERDVPFSRMIESAIETAILPEYKERMYKFLDRDELLGLFEKGTQSQATEYKRLYKGTICWMQMIYHLMYLDDTGDVYIYLYTVNINEEKEKEIELTVRAQTDELTGLYNRQTAIPMIEESLLRDPIPAAVVMFDMDNFKQINDCKGHVYGDEVLSCTAGILRHYFKETDILCRIGGDEFLLFCRNTDENDLRMRLEQITGELVHEYQFGNEKYICSISAGYVMVPPGSVTFQSLYKRADMALFESKRKGRRRYCSYGEIEERPE